jgi:hypothetical protein
MQMLARRILALASVSLVVHTIYPRRCYAESNVVKSESYRERFERLNNDDRYLVLEQYKEKLTKVFGHSHIVSILPSDTIEDLYYVLALYSKPLSPERRILLRNKMLTYLERSNEETQKFYEYILKYYDVL